MNLRAVNDGLFRRAIHAVAGEGERETARDDITAVGDTLDFERSHPRRFVDPVVGGDFIKS